jgi:hypothetical protein
MFGRLKQRVRTWVRGSSPEPFPPGAEVSCEMPADPPVSLLRSRARRGRPPAIPRDALKKLDSALVILEPDGTERDRVKSAR